MCQGYQPNKGKVNLFDSVPLSGSLSHIGLFVAEEYPPGASL